MTSKELTHRDYSVGWVCAMTAELVAAKLVLDKEHPKLARPSNDPNNYILGSIGDHNIAITCLPEGDIGNNPAATVATRMTSTFPSIKFWLMVGVGGGVPPRVRLGDVVVSAPVYETPGLVQWDLGIAQPGNDFRRIGTLNKPPETLRAAISTLKMQHALHGFDKRLFSTLEDIRSKAPQYLQTDNLEDVLFRTDYPHVTQKILAANEIEDETINDDDGVSNCQYCDRAKVVKRNPRNQKTMIHYGLIASGNQVIKDAIRRDEINERFQRNVLCFEMEGAGITISHPCLVIRGISGKSFERSTVFSF
jgi:nucleoside phosphorylase